MVATVVGEARPEREHGRSRQRAEHQPTQSAAPDGGRFAIVSAGRGTGRTAVMPDTRSSRISLSHEVQLDSTVAAVFLERALEQGLGEIRTGDWPTSAAVARELGPASMHLEGERHESSLYEWDGALVLVSRYANHVHAFAAAGSRDGLDLILARLQAALPPPDPSSKHEVTVRFWDLRAPRAAAVLALDRRPRVGGDLAATTAERRGAGLEAMMRGFRPAHGGQLLLWHGTAGTGKTFALRALAWEWRGWCEFHYIVDPDTFFGEHADYLMSVLMEEGSEIVRMQRAMESAAAGLAMGWTSYGADGDEADGRGVGRSQHWRAARARGHRRAAVGRGEVDRRPGPLALPQRRRRPDRAGAAGARPRHDERGV